MFTLSPLWFKRLWQCEAPSSRFSPVQLQSAKMQLQLRSTISHPKASPNTVTDHVFSSRYPRLITAAQDLLIDHATATNATSSVLRTSAKIEKLAYVGGTSPPTLLAFLQDASIALYHDTPMGLELVYNFKLPINKKIPVNTGALNDPSKRPVTFVHASLFSTFAIFVKSDSPSIWCLPIPSSLSALSSSALQPFKLRSDLGADQEKTSVIDGTVAKLRGKVAIKPKLKHSPIICITSHYTLPFIAAAYVNGLIRIWDVDRKEQRLHLDVQLLMTETIVSILFHPQFPVLVACTTHGRIVSFIISSNIYKHGDQPLLPASKVRDRKRRFQSMCFTHSNPPYLVLLTASKRLVVKIITRKGIILQSTRFLKASKPLSTSQTSGSNRNNASTIVSKMQEYEQDNLNSTNLSKTNFSASIISDPTFGLLACSLDNTGSIYLFEPIVNKLPSLRIPISSGLDYSLLSLSTHPVPEPASNQQGGIVQQYLSDVHVHTESLFVYNGTLFSYNLGTERVSKLCRLPAGQVTNIDVARDENGYCIAALVFYHGDDLAEATDYAESQEVMRYVICTRGGEGDYWGTSEPSEGRSGCFLGESGSHDRLIIISPSGITVSISSFKGTSNLDLSKQNQPRKAFRGTQRFKINTGRISKVFRSPFANWFSVCYFDQYDSRVTISKNTFSNNYSAQPDGQGSSVLKQVSDSYSMDDGTSFQLQPKEIVLDVRWQLLSSSFNDNSRNRYQNDIDDYLGAILTNKRIYFIRHVLQPLSTFEFSSISKRSIPFGLPCISWAGPSLMLLQGNFLFTVAIDGNFDFVAGLSSGECATSIVACLPDRLIYVSPSFSSNSAGDVCVRSRPYGGISPIINGLLALPTERVNNKVISKVFEQYDVSQGSIQLVNHLKLKGIYGLAYLMAVSKQGKFSLPPLKRAIFLSHMGDIRGALAVAENEYKKLDSGNDFQQGSELYRLVQRILNIALIIGDFHVCRRCSQLIGKHGTLSAFIDIEGGFDALTSMLDSVRRHNAISDATMTANVVNKLQLLMERSQNSSIASQKGVIPSRRDVQLLRKAITSENNNQASFGSADSRKIFINVVVPQQTESTSSGKLKAVDIVNRVQLENAIPKSIDERLEFSSAESTSFTIDISASTAGPSSVQGEYAEFIEDGPPPQDAESRIIAGAGTEQKAITPAAVEDSSDDDEDIFGAENNFVGPGKGGDGKQEIESLLPSNKGELSQATHEGLEDTKAKIQEQLAQSHSNVRKAQESSKELIQQQQQVKTADGLYLPEAKAKECLAAASEKIRLEKLTAAQKDLDSGVKALSRSVAKGVNIQQKLLIDVVHYKFLCKLRSAMNEITESQHSKTMEGRIAFIQFAITSTNLSLFTIDKVDCLVRAVDGHLGLGNFGMAAEGMKLIKNLGVPDGMREDLRTRYALCQQRGYMNSVVVPNKLICYGSLRAFVPGLPMRACSVCTAVYSIGYDLKLGSLCEYCRVGRIVMR